MFIFVDVGYYPSMYSIENNLYKLDNLNCN